MPLLPTTISAATITNQAMPIEIRIPVSTAGMAAGSTIRHTRVCHGKSSTRATFSHSLRTPAAPAALLISTGQIALMAMMKIAACALSFRA